MNTPAPRSKRFPLGSQVRLADLALNPYPTLRQLQEHEPVSWIDELDLWFVTRRADILDILLDPVTFTVGSPDSLLEDTFGHTMISTDSEEQRRLRQPFAAPFLPKAVRATMTEFVTDQTKQLIGRFIDAGRVELRESFTDPLALYTVTAMLGLPVHDFATFRAWFTAIADALGNFSKNAELRSKGRTAAAEFGAFASLHLNRMSDQSNDSVLAQLWPARQSMSEEELLSAARVIIFGGLETTSALLLNTVWALANHPEQFAAVRAEPGLLVNALEESLRWEPPVQTCTRHVSRPVEIAGVELAAGDALQCMIGAANRDPAHFADPDSFDIRRESARDHLSFGVGKHFCLGAFLARLEGEIGLRTLFERLPSFTLDVENSAPPHGHEFRSPPRLTIQW